VAALRWRARDGHLSATRPGKPEKLRKRYSNTVRATVLLRFEDGHEIRVPETEGRSFDCWAGETITIVALWDPSVNERELLERRKAEAFEDA
jgi:hypothetical protein